MYVRRADRLALTPSTHPRCTLWLHCASSVPYDLTPPLHLHWHPKLRQIARSNANRLPFRAWHIPSSIDGPGMGGGKNREG